MLRRATVAALLLCCPAAQAAELRGPAHGVVDFGDRVAYTVAGKRCAKLRVRARMGPVLGRAGKPRRAEAGCAGSVALPSWQAVRAAGWREGDPLPVALVAANGNRVALRFARVDSEEAAAGAPEVVPAGDDESGPRDLAVRLSAGDAIALGRVRLRGIDSVGLRICLPGADTRALPDVATFTPNRLEAPTFVSIRQDAPDGAAVLATTDVAADPQELSRLTLLGFPGCWRLASLPLTGRVQEDAPELFLRMESGPEGGLTVNSVDFQGTGAKLPPAVPADPPGMRTIFDGTSFDGWSQQHCRLRDGAAVNARDGDDGNIDGCSLTWGKELRDVVVRLRLRREHFTDNGGVYLGDQEIQLRSAGEYLPGGYFGGMAARWQKLTTFPEWSTLEIVQLGARHVVSVNGRTVVDHVRAEGAPEPYRLNVVAQPIWSYRVGAELTFGNEGFPDVLDPAELGAFWFDDIRLLECAGPGDPVCRALADARRGQVPPPQ